MKNTVKSTAIFKSFVAHRENGGGAHYYTRMCLNVTLLTLQHLTCSA